MKTTELLSLIDAEIAKLRQARALIAGASAEAVTEKKKPGRPKATTATPAASAKKKKHKLSIEGRKRIQEAVGRRWAAAKKEGR